VSARGDERCKVCGGTGWTVLVRDGREVAVRCDCTTPARRLRRARASRIPERYLHCTIDGFEIWDRDPGGRQTLARARRMTKEFVDAYPGVELGLLYQGPPGTGKTHLAVAALRELIASKGVGGLYTNAIELVQELQMTFDGGGRSRESILGPVVETELLVLDELGTGKMSPWVQDLLYFVINSRYMARRLTLFTTNYSDFKDSEGTSQLRTQESLADRISPALRSRLFEMTELVDIRCKGDYREWAATVKRRRP
jgi:DNA replication protein DnaC